MGEQTAASGSLFAAAVCCSGPTSDGCVITMVGAWEAALAVQCKDLNSRWISESCKPVLSSPAGDAGVGTYEGSQ